MHLVEDHQALQPGQRQAGVGQAGLVRGVLEIEPDGGSAEPIGDLPGEGGLAHLPRPEHGDDGVAAEEPLDGGHGGGSGKISHDIEI